MKTIIIYASTYGYARECGTQLAKEIQGDVVLVDIAKDRIPSLDDFDNMVIGCSIHMGQVQKKIKLFCTANLDLLTSKNTSLFICCGSPENMDQALKNNLPGELLEKAKNIECFGGEIVKERLNFPHKVLIGIMEKSAAQDGRAPMRKMPENISKLSAAINKY